MHAKWVGRCESCGAWNSLVEEAPREAVPKGLGGKVPGALSSVSRYMVWIESMTTICGRSSRSSVAAMSRMLVAVASSTGDAETARRSARMRTWSIASSPEI